MSERTSATIVLQAADGQTYFGQAEADDVERLADLLGDGPRPVELDAAADTEGHATSDQLFLDVEGHAIALRMPTPADAAALRRGFAAGIVTASLVVGGAAAAIAAADIIGSQAAAPAAPAVDVQQPANDTHPLHLPKPIQRE
jgi:hypothetical protein